MRNTMPLRCWIEAGLSAVTGVLCVITPFWPDWIEGLTGWDPDQHHGSFEWLIAAMLLTVTAIVFWLARVDWKHAKALPGAGTP